MQLHGSGECVHLFLLRACQVPLLPILPDSCRMSWEVENVSAAGSDEPVWQSTHALLGCANMRLFLPFEARCLIIGVRCPATDRTSFCRIGSPFTQDMTIAVGTRGQQVTLPQKNLLLCLAKCIIFLCSGALAWCKSISITDHSRAAVGRLHEEAPDSAGAHPSCLSGLSQDRVSPQLQRGACLSLCRPRLYKAVTLHAAYVSEQSACAISLGKLPTLHDLGL